MFKYTLLYIIFFALSIRSHASIVVLNGLTHTYKTEKAKVYSGKIELQNTGTGPKSVKLYLQDISYSFDGTIHYTAPHTNKKTNADWIKLSTNLVNLKANQSVEIIYQVTVPDSVVREGSYWSTIIIEPVEEINPNTSNSGVQITSIVRYAIQVITDYVNSPIKPELKFEKFGVEKNGRNKILQVALSNKSEIYCRAITSIELYDSEGKQIEGQLESPVMGLLPGNSKTFNIELGNITPGKYKAVVFASDQEENTFAMNIDLEI
ncbi:WxL protein host-binding domain-containing protein [Sphingobacterium gobiense]|uniref:Uncharacterized protein n=1 Tax=Sphingobacterium gobiense TaxID=1382456 RepID=A0A2S9JNF5_9SPHI|nr:DUF3324 domain-containing protein [Sphingobacterium gobiense]PRD54661.1 hypothetical protein C5749_14590 [Sphingobacterium gobiense]